MRIIKNRSLPLVVIVVRDEMVATVGKGDSVVAMEELVEIVTVVLGDSVGTIPE